MGRIETHIKDHKRIFNEVFIETGTYKGDSLNFASSLPFKKLISCDVSKIHFENAKKRFKNNKKIHLYHESSHTLLKKIIDPKKSTTFWLDGHWQNKHKSEIDKNATECPLIAELKQIFSFSWEKFPLILIDDASHYPKNFKDKNKKRFGYKMNQWPSINEIKKVIPKFYQFRIENDVVWLYHIMFV